MTAVAAHTPPGPADRPSPGGQLPLLPRTLRMVCLTYVYALMWLGVLVAVASVIGQRPVVITSGSMAPLLAPGDVVLLGDAPRSVEPGDVVTFRHPGRDGTLVTHRVVAVDADGTISTRGDANDAPDPYTVQLRDVVGTFGNAVPAVGRPLVWLQERNIAALGAWGAITAAAVAVGFVPWRRTGRLDEGDTGTREEVAP
jgi:signal peptidase